MLVINNNELFTQVAAYESSLTNGGMIVPAHEENETENYHKPNYGRKTGKLKLLKTAAAFTVVDNLFPQPGMGNNAVRDALRANIISHLVLGF